MTEHLQKGNEIGNRFDLYLPERCAVCFGDEMEIDGDFEMKQCTNCRIWVHRGCYLENGAEELSRWQQPNWRCDPCYESPEYAETFKMPAINLSAHKLLPGSTSQ